MIKKGCEIYGCVFGAIVVNKVNDKFRIVDGNHRFEAIKEYLSENPSKKIRATFQIVKDLSLDEEKQIFMVVNTMKQQSRMDYVKTQCHESFIYQALMEKKQEFPVEVSERFSKKVGCVAFQTLIEPYIVQERKSMRFATTAELLMKVKGMSMYDYHRLYDFMNAYLDIFGVPNPKTAYGCPAFLIAFQRLYWSADGLVESDEFIERMKENLPDYSQSLIGLANSMNSSFTSHGTLYKKLLECVNKGIGVKRLVRIKSTLEG